MTKQEMFKFLIIRTLGNFLVLFALYGVIITFGPLVTQEISFRIAEARGVQYSICDNPQDCFVPQVGDHVSSPLNDNKDVSIKKSPGFAEVLAGNTEQVLIPTSTQFGLVIPKIGVNVSVMPNVDPANPSEFLSVLQTSVAHAKGSVFPGMNGTIYLFAHSTDTWLHVGRYNAIFYLLKELSLGDAVIIFFDGVRYDYVVQEKVILPATDVSLLSQIGKERLVLQTCWPPGTTWKRLFVVAHLRSEN